MQYPLYWKAASGGGKYASNAIFKGGGGNQWKWPGVSAASKASFGNGLIKVRFMPESVKPVSSNGNNRAKYNSHGGEDYR